MFKNIESDGNSQVHYQSSITNRSFTSFYSLFKQRESESYHDLCTLTKQSNQSFVRALFVKANDVIHEE